MRQVVILDEAGEDLERAKDFYETCEVGAGDYFSDCLIAELASLESHAGDHPERNGFHKMNAKRFPYSIYYDLDEDWVRIVAILDMRQNPPQLRKQLKDRS
ncbi:MAG: type II toxin-antitoxin system RelE/ParE family toxin [Verrucomicrobiota bacterium]